jgi:hypothetical protein
MIVPGALYWGHQMMIDPHPPGTGGEPA